MQTRAKIFSAILLFIFTISTTGIVMNKHLCNGDVKNVTAFVKADNCDHPEVEVKDLPNCHEQESQPQEDECCENDTQQLKVKEQTLAYHKIDIELFVVLSAVANGFDYESSQDMGCVDLHNYYPPPPLSAKQSLHIIHEQYII